MARITVPFSGLTSHPNHKDGECSNIVNLRPKNGYLKPVPPRKVINTLTREYDKVFIHKVGVEENWIGVAQDKKSLYVNINTPNPEKIELNLPNAPFFSEIEDIQQIGNTLTLLTNDGLRYILWADGAYKYLGALPDLPVVNFDTTEMTTKSKSWGEFYGVYPPGGYLAGENKELAVQTMGLAKSIIEETPNYFSDVFYIRYAMRLYDGSVIKSSTPLLVMPRCDFDQMGKAYLPYEGSPPNHVYVAGSRVELSFYKLNLNYNFSVLAEWGDIIKSVDFFASNYIGLSSPDSIRAAFHSTLSPNVSAHNIYPPYKIEDNVFTDSPSDKAVSASNFYLYYSEANFTTPKTATFPNPEVVVKGNFYNIIHQETMPIDSFSHHSIGANNATTYNSRLRLSGITTYLFKGFTADYFNWHSQYNGENNQSFTGGHWLHTVVYIKTDEGVKIVRDAVAISMVNPITLNAFISYPDPRATKIRFLVTDFNETVVYERLVVDLTPHPSLNIAYALKTDLKPFIFNNSMVNIHQLPAIKSKLIEPNKLKVSEVNNPFIFPNINTYQIGSGEILAESSIVMNVSDRNYGMYPMFVFTDSGVFTMAGQTADSVHDSVQAPTYLEPPISKVICPTPYGIAFTTRRGLMMINQDSTTSLSDQLRESDDETVIHDLNEIPEEIIHYPNTSFKDFLSKVDNMLYNPYNDELIIYSSLYDYSYVYDFASKSYYLSTERFTSVVQNSFPKLFVVDQQSIKDYSQAQDTAANISLITRPLSFGTTDIKTLSRIWLRALMYNTTAMSVVAFNSLDGVNFMPIKGVMFGQRHGNYLDTDLGLLSRQTYKHYMLVIAGTCDEQTQIRYAEYEVVKRYNNEKMR